MAVIDLLIQYREALFGGVLTTLRLCALIWGVGLSVGSLLGYLSWRSPLLGSLGRGLYLLVAAIPILVILFWLHYPLQAMLGIVVDPFYTAAGALAFVNVVFVSDIVRRTLVDFPKEYATAARVYGLSGRDTALRIQAPLILRQLIPSLLLTQVSMLQMTLFASLISVDELFRVVQRINSLEYRPVEVYSALAVFFLAICLPLNLLAYSLRQRFTRDLSEN